MNLDINNMFIKQNNTIINHIEYEESINKNN